MNMLSKIIGEGYAQLNKRDFIKGSITAGLTAIVFGLMQCLACLDMQFNKIVGCDPHLPTSNELSVMGIAAMAAMIAYLAKNFFSNSDDKFLKKEPEEINDNGL